MKKLLPFLLLILAGCSEQPISPYVILKSNKGIFGNKFDVLIHARLTKPEMIAIAAKIKKDSSQYDNLKIDFQLPGNSFKNVGGITVYATAAYHDAKKITAADTVNDLHDNRISFDLYGFTAPDAKHLLMYNPKEVTGKDVVGKFIDDNTKTVSIVFKDESTASQLYIIELDTTGKIVSAIQPMIINQGGIEKMIISQKGDYMTLQNDILTMYSSDDPEHPYRSLKAGI